MILRNNRDLWPRPRLARRGAEETSFPVQPAMILWRKAKTTTRWDDTRHTLGGGRAMNVQPQLEELEERSALSLADLAAFC